MREGLKELNILLIIRKERETAKTGIIVSIKVDRSRNFGTCLSCRRSVKYAGVRRYSQDASERIFVSERASEAARAKRS